jgi:hypothetical protein
LSNPHQADYNLKVNLAWHLLNAIKGEFVKELVDESVVRDLLQNKEIGNPSQIPIIINFLLRHNKGEFIIFFIIQK